MLLELLLLYMLLIIFSGNVYKPCVYRYIIMILLQLLITFFTHANMQYTKITVFRLSSICFYYFTSSYATFHTSVFKLVNKVLDFTIREPQCSTYSEDVYKVHIHI